MRPDDSRERFLPAKPQGNTKPGPEALVSFSGRIGSSVHLGAQTIQLTPGASSTCTGSGCTCSSCCCW